MTENCENVINSM